MNRLFLIFAAVVAAVLGIYVIYTDEGNDPMPFASNLSGSGETCSLQTELAQKLDNAIGGQVAAFRVVDAGIDVSGLSFNDRQGNPVSLADWKGRTVLLNLWATWCAPCREEMPALDKLEETMGGEEFQVVPVSIDLDSDEKPKGFYDRTGIRSLPFFHDGSTDIFNNLKKQGLAFGMPTTLLVDKNSCVMGVLNGPAHWASDDARKLIGAALKL